MARYTIEIQTRIILHEVSGMESNMQNIVSVDVNDTTGVHTLDESNDTVLDRNEVIRSINNLVDKAISMPPPEALPIT